MTKIRTTFLESLTVLELKGLCKEHGIKGYSKLKKAEIIQLIITALQPQAEELAQAVAESGELSGTTGVLEATRKGGRIQQDDENGTCTFTNHLFKVGLFYKDFYYHIFTIDLGTVDLVTVTKSEDLVQGTVWLSDGQLSPTLEFKGGSLEVLQGLKTLAMALNGDELPFDAIEHFKYLQENLLEESKRDLVFRYDGEVFGEIALFEKGQLLTWVSF